MHKILIAICSCTAILMVSNNNISYCMEQLDKKEQHIKLIDELTLIQRNFHFNIGQLVQHRSEREKDLGFDYGIETFLNKIKQYYNIIFPENALGAKYITEAQNASDFCRHTIRALQDMKYSDEFTIMCMVNIKNAFDALIKNDLLY